MKKILKKVLIGVIFIILIIIYQCPIRLIFGIECPGCGLTAAILAALRLDFKQAFAYHPLFPIPIITIAYLLIRRQFSFPKKVESFIGIAFIIAFSVNYIAKLSKGYF